MTDEDKKAVNVTLMYAMGDDIDDELMKIIHNMCSLNSRCSVVNSFKSIPIEIWYDLIKIHGNIL